MAVAKAVAMKTVYDDPAYWNGNIGYRPPGYADFDINVVKEALVLLLAPKSVLDLGCAYGFSVARWNHLGIPAKGLDISEYALSQAHPDVKPFLVHGPVWDMPFQNGEFDVVYSSGMLEHVPKSKLLDSIKEIVRVGKRGLIGVSCWDDPTTHQGDDESHEVILPRDDWQALFPPSFVVVSDSAASWKSLLLSNLWRVINR